MWIGWLKETPNEYVACDREATVDMVRVIPRLTTTYICRSFKLLNNMLKLRRLLANLSLLSNTARLLPGRASDPLDITLVPVRLPPVVRTVRAPGHSDGPEHRKGGTVLALTLSDDLIVGHALSPANAPL